MSRLARAVSTLLAASLLAAPVAAQQLYRSVGPDGRVQYSDRPPTDGRKAEKVTSTRVNTAPADTAQGGDATKPNAPQSLAEKEQEFRKRRIEAEEKARKEQKLAEQNLAKNEACTGMRRQLASMQAGGRITRMTESGERVFLEDAEIQQEIAKVQRDIASNCK
jgi:Domain of unknown function (DUF4124)